MKFVYEYTYRYIYKHDFLARIFRPVQPHIVCCGYVNCQGVFLKRQQEAHVVP